MSADLGCGSYYQSTEVALTERFRMMNREFNGLSRSGNTIGKSYSDRATQVREVRA
jgi:hypothetical protein